MKEIVESFVNMSDEESYQEIAYKVVYEDKRGLKIKTPRVLIKIIKSADQDGWLDISPQTIELLLEKHKRENFKEYHNKKAWHKWYEEVYMK